MSRFEKLELGSAQVELSPPATAKGEAYYLNEARVAFESGRFEPALRAYSKVLEYNPDNASAWSAQVRMLIELGEIREAKLWADKALERFPKEPELMAAKAVALGRSGDLEGALAFSDASIEEHGDTPYVWLARGDVLLARAESRAEYCLQKALLLAPSDWFVAWLAARIRHYYRQFSLALRLLQRAVELKADHFVLWLELGLNQQALGLTGPAMLSFQQARQLNPHCEEAQQALARLAQRHGLARLGDWVRHWFRR